MRAGFSKNTVLTSHRIWKAIDNEGFLSERNRNIKKAMGLEMNLAKTGGSHKETMTKLHQFHILGEKSAEKIWIIINNPVPRLQVVVLAAPQTQCIVRVIPPQLHVPMHSP